MNNDELTKAWATLTAQLTNAASQVDALTEGRDASERAEGYRFLTRILVAMTEFQQQQQRKCFRPDRVIAERHL